MDEFERENYLMFLQMEEEKKGASKDNVLTASSLLASLVCLEIPYNMAMDITLRQLMEVINEVTNRRNKANDNGSK